MSDKIVNAIVVAGKNFLNKPIVREAVFTIISEAVMYSGKKILSAAYERFKPPKVLPATVVVNRREK